MGDNMVAANEQVNRKYNEELAWTGLKAKADLAVKSVTLAEESVVAAQKEVVVAKDRASAALLEEALARTKFEKRWGKPPEHQMKWANDKGE